jgi:CO/xanthine dehydrogenase Mo-binding subunit
LETEFHYPTTPDEIMGGHFLYTFAGVAVQVEVNLLTGRVKLLNQYHTIAAGPVMNPQGYLGQIEGGSSMALGFTLSEDALMENGQYLTKNLDTYLIPTLCDVSRDFTLEAIEDLPKDDLYGPRGVGEIGTVILAPAIASAVFNAVGKRITKLPIQPELLQEDFHIPEGVI